MDNDRRRYGDPCGIARALDIVGERWALLVVRELLLGPRRFGQLRAALPELSPNVLTQRLRELADAGVARRELLAPPASVTVYELTDRGRALEQVLLELGRWGSATPRVGGREMSAASLIIALKTMFDPTGPLPAVAYGLRLGAESFTVQIGAGAIEIRRAEHPATAPPTATLSTDVTTLRMIAFLGRGVRAAEEGGVLTITGDRRAAARFPKYFRHPRAGGSGDREDSRGHELSVDDHDFAHRCVRLSPTIRRRAGVEGALPVMGLVPGDVRVPEHHERRCRKHPAQPRPAPFRRSAVVDHRDRQSGQVELQRVRRAPLRDVRAVVVATHRMNGRPTGQLVENLGRAHITGVQDRVGAVQCRRDARRAPLPTPRGVGVGQHRDPHGLTHIKVRATFRGSDATA